MLKFFKTTIIAIACTLTYTSIFSQDVCNNSFEGKVIDSISNKEIEAVVTILEGQRSVICNLGSGFTFKNICKTTIHYHVELLGYRSVDFTAQLPQSTPIKISLAPLSIGIKEFIKIEHKREEMEALNKVVLKDIDLVQAQGASLGEGLKNVAGVSTLSTGSNIVKPVIHGMHSNRILILNNGVRQEGQNWGSEHAPEIDPFIANNISVIKGANAVRYGSDAIAGVILVEPKKLSDIIGLNTEINLAGYSNGMGGATSGIVEYSNKKYQFIKARIQGTFRQLANVTTPNYLLNNTAMLEKNYSAALGFVKENYGIELFKSNFNTVVGLFNGSHIGNLTDLEYAFTQAKPRKEFIDSFTYKIGRPKQLIVHDLYKFNAYFYDAKVGKFSFTYAFQENKRSEFDAHRPRNNYEAASNKPELQFNLSTQTADLAWEHNVSKGFSGTMGLTGLWQSNYYEGRNLIPNFLIRTYGVFIIEHYTKNKIELEFGARYDVREMSGVKRNKNNSISQPQFNYKVPSATVGVIYTENKYTIKGYVGTAYRAPAINELFINGVHHGSGRFEIGDETLKPEKAFNSSVNVIYKQNKFVEFQVEAYNNYIVDYIYLQPTKPSVLTVLGAFPTFSYRQTNARLYGIDANVKFQLHKKVVFNSKVSILYARNLSNDSWIELMPANRFDNEFIINLPKNYLFNFTIVHTMQQSRTNPNVDYAAPPKAYTLLNAHLTKSFTIKKTKLVAILGCNNMLNTVYRDYMNSFRYYADEVGRNIYLKIKINF